MGVLKGAIARVNPQIVIIDLSHEIPRHNLAAARFCLANSYAYFPPGTVHLAVVDPGVGSQRRGVAIQFPGGYLVGPDNGLFSGVFSLSEPLVAVSLTNNHYWGTQQPSGTFHGRDIFAPVAAHLASGVALQRLGELIEPASLVQMHTDIPTVTDNKIIACVQHVDIFGNVITNIPAKMVPEPLKILQIGNQEIPLRLTYSEGTAEQAIALIGSHGWLEIAVNCGSAQRLLDINTGDRFEVCFQD